MKNKTVQPGILLVSVMLLALSACGDRNDSDQSEVPATSEQSMDSTRDSTMDTTPDTTMDTYDATRENASEPLETTR